MSDFVEVKRLSCSALEYVEYILACSFEVSCRIVATRNEDLRLGAFINRLVHIANRNESKRENQIGFENF